MVYVQTVETSATPRYLHLQHKLSVQAPIGMFHARSFWLGKEYVPIVGV